jgi:transposase
VIILQAFKFKLKTNEQVEATCRVFAGHRRWVYNYFVKMNAHRLKHGYRILRYHEMEFWLSKIIMKSEECVWMKDAPKAVLQQALRDLDKAYKGAFDKTLVEFKLASNSKLRQNLTNQVEIYKKAHDTEKSIKAILFFSKKEEEKVKNILVDLGISNEKYVVLIDARKDNKLSASMVK